MTYIGAANITERVEAFLASYAEPEARLIFGISHGFHYPACETTKIGYRASTSFRPGSVTDAAHSLLRKSNGAR